MPKDVKYLIEKCVMPRQAKEGNGTNCVHFSLGKGVMGAVHRVRLGSGIPESRMQFDSRALLRIVKIGIVREVARCGDAQPSFISVNSGQSVAKLSESLLCAQCVFMRDKQIKIDLMTLP
jgi:hypothetical protein